MAIRNAVRLRALAGLGLAALLGSTGLLAALPSVALAPAPPQSTGAVPSPTGDPPTSRDDAAGTPADEKGAGEKAADEKGAGEKAAPIEQATVEPQPSDAALSTDGVAPPQHLPLTLETVNDAVLHASLAGGISAAALKAQILLDRAGFSPGAINAADNGNFRKALTAFQRENELDASGRLDPATSEVLLATADEPVLTEYEITPADLRGPFVPDLPDDVEEQVGIKRLAYRNPAEMLAERFHMDRRLLLALNPQAAFDAAGTRIIVARVGRPDTTAKVMRIEVDKAQRRLRAYDKDGRLVAAYPASVGSADKPTPSGAYKVRAISRFPEWRYNPRFAFKEIKSTRAFRVGAGPNNPLGTVWIGISKPSYGIHGTPVAEEVGTSFSHGCVRLTNWDVQALASMVTRKTVVEFVD